MSDNKRAIMDMPDRHLEIGTRHLMYQISAALEKDNDAELDRNQTNIIGAAIFEFLSNWDKHRAMHIENLEARLLETINLIPRPFIIPTPK